MKISKSSLILVFSITSLLVFAPCGAKAQLAGTQVTGHIYFNGGFTIDGYDPAHGAVPAGYENTAGTTVPVSDTAVEFGFSDSYNFDTADFTDVTLTLTDKVNLNGAVPWQQTFTDPSFSGVLTKISDTFGNGGVSASTSGDTITVNWPGTNLTNVTYTAVFNVGSAVTVVPEPSTWTLLGLGMAGVGVAWLRRSGAQFAA